MPRCISVVLRFRWDRYWADLPAGGMVSCHPPARGSALFLRADVSWERLLGVPPLGPWPRLAGPQYSLLFGFG